MARSLYRKPDILILDEATNALDEKNEKAFFDNLLNNYPNITLIIISHNKKYYQDVRIFMKLKIQIFIS